MSCSSPCCRRCSRSDCCSTAPLFPLAPLSQSVLTTAAALAERCLGAPWLIAAALGAGRGDVVSATYEYGWVLMVVAGLLNCLVILDAFDIAMGRK